MSPKRHLNYANVVATLALFAALGGSAWAVSKIGTSDIQNGAVTSKKLAKAAVATKKVANDAITGKKADEDSFGTVPEASIGRGPLAYARVTANGNVIEADSRGVSDANVTESPSHAGLYCFTGLDGVKSAMAVGEGVEGVTGIPNLDPEGGPGFCPQRQIVIGMLQVDEPTVTPDEQPFYVWFFG